VEVKQTEDGFFVSMVSTPYRDPYHLPPDDIDKLFKSHLVNIMAWGIIEDGKLVAAVETAVEELSNRLRISIIWVDEAYRRQGIGTALLDIAMQRALSEKRRVLMLETQSYNSDAIAFYLRYGFTLIGFDSCAYHNDDLERKEVRMELGIILEYS